MQLTHHADLVIPVTSSTPNRHTHATIRVADARRDQSSPIATRITLNTGSAKTRHFCASQLYLGGMDLIAIQEALGHAWVATTMGYVHVHATHVEDAWIAGQERAATRLEGLAL
jgi:site-specific recombinase XerD